MATFITDNTGITDNTDNTGITGKRNLSDEERRVVPTTEEFAPDLYQILTNITSMIDTNAEYNYIITYIINENWNDIIKLNRPPDNNLTTPNGEDIISAFSSMLVDYEKQISDIEEERLRENRKNSAIKSVKERYMSKIIPKLKEMLESLGITMGKVFNEKINQIKSLKAKLNDYLNENPGSGSLYKLEITENNEELIVNVKYTNLGYLIMLKTEINHDLQKFLSNKQSATINSQLDIFIENVPILRTMLTDDKNKDIIYNENTAIELVLAILEHKKVKIISEKNNNTCIDTTKPEGASTLPQIWKENDINITSDADNAGAFKVLTAGENRLKQYNDNNKQILNLDAGSSPKVSEGIQNEYIEREKTLKSLHTDTDTTMETEPIIKSVTYNIYNPDGGQIIKIQNTNIYDKELYDITIYKTKANPKKTKIVNATNNEEINVKVKNLSIPTVIDAINKTDNEELMCNTAILKSLGDLIVYQVLSYITALRHPDSINITSSIDYSAIFTTLKDIEYKKNGSDVTQELNRCNIYAGCNFYGSNGFVPLTERSKDTLDYLYTIADNHTYLDQKLILQYHLGNIFFTNTTYFKQYNNLYNSLSESGLGNINNSIDDTQPVEIREGLTNLQKSLNTYASDASEYLNNQEGSMEAEDILGTKKVDAFDNTFVEILIKILIAKIEDLEIGGGSKKNNKSKKSKNQKKRTRKNRKNPISK